VDFTHDQERGFKQLLEILDPRRSESWERQRAAERAQAEPTMRIESFRRKAGEHARREEERKQVAEQARPEKADVPRSGVDIFLSYQNSDVKKASILADAFQKEGWSVWWDRRIPPGKTWAEVIESSIRKSRCVVVLWSKTSVNSKWVKKEARFAERRACLIPVLIDRVEAPFEFEDLQAADLTGWKGERTEAFLHLVAELRSRLQIGSSTVNNADD
jgi:TIR domain